MILDSLEMVPSSGRTKQLFILSHGRFNNKAGMLDLAQRLAPHMADVKFVLPDAPFLYNANNPDPLNRQWFDMTDEDASGRRYVTLPEIETSSQMLNAFVDRQRDKEGLKDSDVFMGGFSQGAIISLYAGLARQAPVAGILAWSGMLVSPGDPSQWAKTPVYMYHGDQDQALRIDCYHDAVKKLRAAGIQVWDTVMRGVGHSIERQGIDHAAGFVKHVLLRTAFGPKPLLPQPAP